MSFRLLLRRSPSAAALLLSAGFAVAPADAGEPVRASVSLKPRAMPMRWIPRSPAPAVDDGSSRAPAETPSEGARDSLPREFRRQQSRLRRYPSKADPHLRLGEIYYRVGNDYAARYHLERYLDSAPTGADSVRAARLRARCLIRLDRLFEATVALEQLARTTRAAAGIDHDRALLLRRDHLPMEGVMAEMRAVERSTGDPDFLREAVAQWKEQLHPAQALTVAELLCRDPRAGAEDHFQAGYLWHRLGRREPSARRYEAVLARDPDHAEAHYNLALLREEGGDLAGAVEHWREVLRLRPAYDPTYFHLATIFLEQERKEEATQLFEDYLRHGSDFPALVEAAAILNGLGVPPERWRVLLDARTEELAAAGRRLREEAERAAARGDSIAAMGGPAGERPAPIDSSGVPATPRP